MDAVTSSPPIYQAIAVFTDEYDKIISNLIKILKNVNAALDAPTIGALEELQAKHGVHNKKITWITQKLLYNKDGPSYLNLLPEDVLLKVFSFMENSKVDQIIHKIVKNEFFVRVKWVNQTKQAFHREGAPLKMILSDQGKELRHFGATYSFKPFVNEQAVSVLDPLLMLTPELTSINLDLWGLTTDQLLELSRRFNPATLKHLKIANNKIATESISQLSFLTNLETLDVRGNVHPIRHVIPFNLFPKLNKVCSPYDLACESLEQITVLTKLTSLKVFFHKQENNVSVVSQLTSLKKLRLQISCPFFDNSRLSFLNPLTKLTQLDLSGSFLTPQAMDFISTMHPLKVLSLSSNNIGNESNQLSSLTALTHLSLRNSNLINTRTEFISSLSSLRFLDLSNNKINFIESAFFEPCTQLETLKLYHNEFYTMACFTSLANLKLLELTENPISDSTMKHLSRLSNLTELDFRGCSLGCFSSLTFFHPLANLRKLSLNKDKLPQGEILKLLKVFHDRKQECEVI